MKEPYVPRFLSTPDVIAGLVIVLGLSLSSTVIGQDDGAADPTVDESIETNPDARIEHRLRPRARYTFETGIDQPGNGDFRVLRTGLDYRIAFPIATDTKLALDFGYEYNSYDFDPPNTFFAGVTNPFTDIHIMDLGVTGYKQSEDPSVSWFGSVKGRFAGEGDVDVSDASTIGGTLGFQKVEDNGVTWSLGVFATSRLEDGLLVLPAITLAYPIDNDWSLLVNGTSGELQRDFGDGLKLGLGLGWERREFRLEERPGVNGSIVEDSGFPVFGRVAYEVDKDLSIDLRAGMVLGQEFEISNRNGNGQRQFEVDASPFVQLGLVFRF